MGIRPVKTEWWGAGVVVCLEQAQTFIWHRVVPERRPLDGCMCID